MKATVIILLSVFMVVIAMETNAQVTDAKANPKTSSLINDASHNQNANASTAGSASQINSLRLEGVEGQIYIGSKWPIGKVVLRNGSTIDNYCLRYNLLADQLQFISGKDTLAFAAPQELSSVTFDGHTFVYENYQCENTLRQGYFELLVPGDNELLLKRIVTYEMPDATYPDNASATRYLIDERYFISRPGKPANKILCNRKSVLTVLNAHNDEIEEYLQITGNKVRNEDDLKKLVIYYNALEAHE